MVAPLLTLARRMHFVPARVTNMRAPRFLMPAVLAGALCVAYAASVHTDYDHKADFSRYRTYSWIGVRAGNSLWQDRIMGAVDSQLAAKGWTRVDAGGDAAISAFGKTSEQDTMETFYNGLPGWGWMGWEGTATTQVIPQRVCNLTVDVFDGASKRLIWRGTAEETLSSKPEKNDKKLEHSVSEMFDHFPPKSRG
jgi:hypothetical protein